MTEPTVLTQLDQGVLTITLNRPEKLNAWTPSMAMLFTDTMAAAETDADVRVIVVTGAGRAFCAGADIGGSMDSLDDDRSQVRERRWDAFPPVMSTPVIAAVNGHAIGLGFTLALQCDIRFVAADAKLSTAFTRRGLVAEHGSSTLLPRLVGRGRAMDLLLSSRVFLGEEAGRIGFAEFVLPAVEVLPAARAYALEMAAESSPTALAVIKAQVDRHATYDDKAALVESDELMIRSFGWPDAVEGALAWQEKRPPRFPPLDPEAARLDNLHGSRTEPPTEPGKEH